MRNSYSAKVIGGLLVLALLTVGSLAQSIRPIDEGGIRQLQEETLGTAQVSVHRATGSVSFVRLVPGSLSLDGDTIQSQAESFLKDYGSVFGINDISSQLTPPVTKRGQFGGSRLTYQQIHNGTPVFGGMIQVHFNGHNELVAVNGMFVPGIRVNNSPVRGINPAGAAIRHVENAMKHLGRLNLTASTPILYVYRDGLLKGIPGKNLLVYEVEVGNGSNVREFAYIDAHNGDLINMITGIHGDIDRRIHDQSINNTPIWSEGDALPYDTGDPDNDSQINSLIEVSNDTYEVFFNVSLGTFRSYDGQDATMVTVYNDPNINCPNANWNGTSTNYCDGVTGDDTIAHEWTHAYTDGTHNLIYQWQSGALNESYSDIFGEVVDIINGTGTDTPDVLRLDGDCSLFGGAPPINFDVNAPGPIVGTYPASGANFNPAPPFSLTGDLELVNDETGTATDGCEPLVGFTSGMIALIDRGGCSFVAKVNNAITAGAVGVVIINNQGNGVINMGGDGPLVPSNMVGGDTGALLKETLETATVNVTIEQIEAGDNSLRWLSGEDDPAFGGAIRDMWNPTCFGDPGKVSDIPQYVCTEADSGGVHTNSGVPNHAFALLVDGGTYNGHTVAAIGLTKATSVYWRAMSVYQTLTSNFYDHADALEQSCADLLGVDLPSLEDGTPSGEVITLADCEAIANAMLATEMRTPPTFCNFIPQLGDVDALEGILVFEETFDSDPGDWTLTNEGVFQSYTPRDWSWSDDTPMGGNGGAFFGENNVNLGDCNPANENLQAGVMHLTSPEIEFPESAGGPALIFDHWFAIEEDYDGGNLSISVNGGNWETIPGSAFIANGYTSVLLAAPDNTNPLEGQEAFHGADGGSNAGSWGQSQVDLSSFAGPGDTIQVRFSMGADDCNGRVGWYVDNVTVMLLGADKIGIYRPSNNNFYLDSNGDGRIASGDTRMRMGGSGDMPLVGDWNGDGVVDHGVFRPGSPNTFYLRLNGGATFTGGSHTARYWMGAAGDLPVVGDWDGNGSDTIGVYRPSTASFIVRYGANNGAVRAVAMGSKGDVPVVGDWNGNGTDTIGIYRPSNNTYYLRNSGQWSGFASLADVDIRVTMGGAGDMPIVGDWNGDGRTNLGIFRPAVGNGPNNFYLDNGARHQMGAAGDMPIIGNW